MGTYKTMKRKNKENQRQVCEYKMYVCMNVGIDGCEYVPSLQLRALKSFIRNSRRVLLFTVTMYRRKHEIRITEKYVLKRS